MVDMWVDQILYVKLSVYQIEYKETTNQHYIKINVIINCLVFICRNNY